MKSFQFNESFPFICVLNNLEKPEFSVDLWELFGTEDNFKKALVGKWDARKGDFKSITWDWPVSNIKHVFNLIFYLDRIRRQEPYLQDDFESFYRRELESSTDLTDSLVKAGLTRPVRCFYVMRYKKQFPALIIEWEKIRREPLRERQLLITFKPVQYFMMDPDAWHRVLKKSDDLREWVNAYRVPKNRVRELKSVFSKYASMKQRVYRLLPERVLHRGILRSKVFFTKSVERFTSVKVVPDNFIFWTLFYHFTGASRAKYDVKIDSNYLIRNIPIDALNAGSNVYKHEAGVANVLSHVLTELFGTEYLQHEFKGRSEISYKDTRVFKREFQVRDISGEESNEFSDVDYDFALNLEPLGKNMLVLIDLTTALWKKGLLPYEEYIRRWRETCFNIPARHANVFLIWYVLINETESQFFQGPPPNRVHNSFDEMLRDLSSGYSERIKIISDKSDLESYSGERVIILKLFKRAPASKNVEEELNNLLNNYKKTLFYETCFRILRSIIKPV